MQYINQIISESMLEPVSWIDKNYSWYLYQIRDTEDKSYVSNCNIVNLKERDCVFGLFEEDIIAFSSFDMELRELFTSVELKKMHGIGVVLLDKGLGICWSIGSKANQSKRMLSDYLGNLEFGESSISLDMTVYRLTWQVSDMVKLKRLLVRRKIDAVHS